MAGTLTIEDIAEALASQEAPSTIVLGDLNISSIPRGPFDLLYRLRDNEDIVDECAIRRLALNRNRLRTLPPYLNLLIRLRYLNLRSNAFVEFPQVLLEMDSLEILDISRNCISTFPLRPGTLRSIRVLHVGRNRIKCLPTYLPRFTELVFLKVEHNPLEWPPPIIMNKMTSEDPEDAAKSIKVVQRWISDNPRGSHGVK